MYHNKINIHAPWIGCSLFITTALTALGGLAYWQSTGPAAHRLHQQLNRKATMISARQGLTFEANRGQADRAIRFQARGPHYAIGMTAQGAVLRLGARNSPPLLIQPLDANPRLRIRGEQMLAARHHYLTGSKAARWHTDIPTYAKVRYTEVYPGIDMVFYGQGKQLEYDFEVAPGADPENIRLGFSGTGNITIDRHGRLLLHHGTRRLLQDVPRIYQWHHGRKIPVAGRYRLTGPRQLGFSIAAYDSRLPLIIDPVLVYASYLGASGDDRAQAIAVDSSHNIYLAGTTDSTDLAVTSGAVDSACGTDSNCNRTPPDAPVGKSDFFITKLAPDGTPLYTTYLGGSQQDVATGIAVNAAGEVFVSGYSASPDFPTTAGAFDPACTDTSPSDGFCDEGQEAVIVKLNASGNALVYASYLGGQGDDQATAIAIDGSGNAFLTGSTASGNFPKANPFAGGDVFAGTQDAFVAKFNASGSALLYADYLGGSATDVGRDIAVDSSGNAYLTGYTASTDFPVSAGALDSLCGTNGQCDGLVDDNQDGQFETIHTFDAFVTKIGSNGSLLYSTYLGGERYDYGNAIAVDGSGRAYVAGETRSANFPAAVSTASFQDTIAGSYDGYLTRLNAAGSALDFFSYLGGGSGDSITAIAVDSQGDIYAAGSSLSRAFPTQSPFVAPPPQRQDNAVIVFNANAFVAKFSNDAGSLRYASLFGGQHNDRGTALAIDKLGNAYLTGYTLSADLPVTSNAQQPIHANIGPDGGIGASDSFLATINDADGDLSVVLSGAPAAIQRGNDIRYQAIVTNDGAMAVDGARLRYEIPRDTDLVSAVPSQGKCSRKYNTIDCQLGLLSNGARATVDIAINPRGAGDFLNTVTVAALINDSNPANNSDQAMTTVKALRATPKTDNGNGGSLSISLLLTLLAALSRQQRKTNRRKLS